ncbi:MAG: AAA domain-containing protein [Propioniciclava sp.]|uniref:AAA domain-containing protein n=1 Tax=Propioniciclava sp. TaxID=2038686 RepID=UPI0039E25838
MYDPRQVAILVKFGSRPAFEDKTGVCQGYRVEGSVVRVTLPKGGGAEEYPVRADGFLLLQNPAPVATATSHLVIVNGRVEEDASEVWRFDGAGASWLRVFILSDGAETYRTYPDDEVELLPRAHLGAGAEVLGYLRRLVGGLPGDDPLRPPYREMRFLHDDSALVRYLEARTIERNSVPKEAPSSPVFPFSFNPSQREAVEKALEHPLSVIDGPPGTGKTQTILNLVANILLIPGATVGVVSFNNAAVDNVRSKLDAEGLGFVTAWLGNKDKRETFFGAQSGRNRQVREFLAQEPPDEVDSRELAAEAGRLLALQKLDCSVARARERLSAHIVEQRYFEAHLPAEGLPELDGIPLLKRSPERIIRYLAESDYADAGTAFDRLVGRIKGYFLFGSTRMLDPEDIQTVLQLQRVFYRKRIEEITAEIVEGETRLAREDYETLAERHRALSLRALYSALDQRYREVRLTEHDSRGYKRRFARFSADYPVILSTCHSLRRNLPDGYLLDYLIIDEASQVDLLTASLAMSVCRTLIVVGDERQLPQISNTEALRYAGQAPHSAYDYQRHSILTSLVALYGNTLPRTMLREHYRCHPDIIGFCNKKFYRDQLVPFTRGNPGDTPLRLIRTSPGNHMRRYSGGGNINQREAELVARRVIPEHFAGVEPERIGIVTPYRRQVGTITAALGDELLDQGSQVDTVHKFQGREKDIVIMSAVLDGTRQGAIASKFADDEHLINVAVSRAVQQLVLVTHHEDLPRARNLRDLAGYIGYRYPAEVKVDHTLLSVFDLLYQEYSHHLRPLAARLRGDMRYRSEDIVWTLLGDLLDQPEYAYLEVGSHVMLRNLIASLDRLSAEQRAFVRTIAHLDFVIYNRITNRPVLAIEVDGFAHHANDPVQLARDATKDALCAAIGLPVLRLATTGSDEEARIVAALKDVGEG